jgi:hypothetical protein
LNAHGGAGVELYTMPVRLWVKYKIQFDILGHDIKCHISVSFLICKFLNVDKCKAVKYSLTFILQDIFGAFEIKIKTVNPCMGHIIKVCGSPV